MTEKQVGFSKMSIQTIIMNTFIRQQGRKTARDRL